MMSGASDKELYLLSISQDFSEIVSKLTLEYDDDLKENGPAALEASADALSLLKDHMHDPQAISSLPIEFQPLFDTMAQYVSSAERQVRKIHEIVSRHYSIDNINPEHITATSRTRNLSSKRNLFPQHTPGVSAADYHIRARQRRMHQRTGGFGQGFHHQQGYHRARTVREEGGMRRRLNDDNICVDIDPIERKAEQCVRLANCSRNYSLYDLFVFYFGGYFDFETGEQIGEVDFSEIQAFDETDLTGKVRFAVISQCILYTLAAHLYVYVLLPLPMYWVSWKQSLTLAKASLSKLAVAHCTKSPSRKMEIVTSFFNSEYLFESLNQMQHKCARADVPSLKTTGSTVLMRA